MRTANYLLLPFVLLLLCGCEGRSIGESQQNGIRVVAETVSEVAKDLKNNKNLPEHAAILNDQSKILDQIVPEDPNSPVPPSVTEAEIRDNPTGAAAKSREVTEVIVEKIIKEQMPFWKKMGIGSLVTGTLGAALWAAQRFGGPVGTVAAGVMRTVFPKLVKDSEVALEGAQEKAATGAAAVLASDVGRLGLDLLDKELEGTETGTKLAEKIHKITKGQVSSIHDLFTWLAKNDAVDNGNQAAVSSLLKELRDDRDTDGGAPATLIKLLG